MLKGRVHRIVEVLIVGVFASTLVSCSSGQFEQVGYHKKTLSNGANFRVFSIYVSEFRDDPDMWSKIQSHAKLQSYTPGGTTTVFFFKNRDMTPDVTFVGEKFDEKYEPYCVAGYWKYPTGNEQFSKFPFEK